MSVNEIIAELPNLSEDERRQVIERAIELDDFSEEELKLINDRIAEHESDPGSSVAIGDAIAGLRKKYRL
jgi:hypothetical protein